MSEMLSSTLFRYQAWANNAFFETLEALDAIEHQTDCHQALRLMNHAYEVAEIFAAHLVGRTHPYKSDNTELDAPPWPSCSARCRFDRWYLDYVNRTTADGFPRHCLCIHRWGQRFHVAGRDDHARGAARRIRRGEVGRLLTRLSLETPWDTFAVFLHEISQLDACKD